MSTTHFAFLQPQNWLGIGIMVLLVVYHYVTADVQPQQQQQ